MRQLATIRRIEKIEPIPEADKIEVCTVDGWKVVSQKGLYNPGDLAVFCEIDSWMPEELVPWMIKEKKAREYNGVPGERLRTIRLRGQISQGLLLPLKDLNDPSWLEHNEGDNVTEKLGIQLYEKPIPTQLSGMVKRNWPHFLRKTDQERVQNLKKHLEGWIMEGGLWEVTEKLDGSSMTVYVEDGEIGVCSRNLDLKETEGNAFWRVCRDNKLDEKLLSFASKGRNFALQGELVGEGVQGNHYGFKGLMFFLYDVWDIDKQEYLSPSDRSKFAEAENIPTVPVLEVSPITKDVDWFLEYASGPSQLNPTVEREGVVFRWLIDRVSFKAISNDYLMENDG